MKLIDKIISTLEMFTERQHEEVLDCIPDLNRSRPINWREELNEQVTIYQRYLNTLESLQRSRNLDTVPRDLLVTVLDYIDEMEEE